MKKTTLIIIISIIAVLLVGCQLPEESTPDSSNVPETTAPPKVTAPPETTTPPETTAPPETTITTEPDPTAPSISDDPEVVKFQALLYDWSNFNPGNWYLQALNCEYKTALEIDLECLFYNGFAEESRDPTDAEIEYINGLELWGSQWQCMNFFRYPVEKMDAVLQQYFGITYAEANKEISRNFIYWEETNCYYSAHTGAIAPVPVVYAVTHLGDGSIAVNYYDKNSLKRFVLTLKENGDDYLVISHLRA